MHISKDSVDIYFDICSYCKENAYICLVLNKKANGEASLGKGIYHNMYYASNDVQKKLETKISRKEAAMIMSATDYRI